MSPALPQHDLADVGLCDADRKSDGRLGFSTRPSPANFADLGFSELGCTTAFPSGAIGITATRPAFDVSVCVIVGGRSEPEMIGANAGWVIAMMKNPEAVWNGPVMEFPREAVSSCVPLVDLETPVAISIFPALPFPTPVSLSGVFPEPSLIGKSRRVNSSLGITMIPPSTPMAVTPTSRNYRGSAINNRASLHACSLAQMVAI